MGQKETAVTTGKNRDHAAFVGVAQVQARSHLRFRGLGRWAVACATEALCGVGRWRRERQSPPSGFGSFDNMRVAQPVVQQVKGAHAG